LKERVEKEMALTEELKDILLAGGADLADAGDLSGLPETVRCGLPVGVSIAVKYPKDVIRGISELPTQEYRNWYGALNERLDWLSAVGAEFLIKKGYRAVAQTRERVGGYDEGCQTVLPHKTVATRAGIGWIGKSALLITKQYGSMVRLSSILTDAPLSVAEPVDHSLCGGCTVCETACPAGAIHGILWDTRTTRDELFDYRKCREMALSRAEQGYGKRETLCGKCIEVCPYTRRYIAGAEAGEVGVC